MLNVTTAIGTALLAFSALSFLGLGVQPPFYDWGRMLNEGLGRIYINPAGALAPGAAIVLAGLTFNLLGEGLAQVASGRHAAVPPRARRRRRVPGRRRPPTTMTSDLVLDVGGLSVSFPSPGGDVLAVRDVSLAGSSRRDRRHRRRVGLRQDGHRPGDRPARLLSRRGDRSSGCRFDGRDVVDLPPGERRRLLATSLPMVFQNPGTTLNPALRVGRQLAEVSEVHDGDEPRGGDAASRRQAPRRSPSPPRNGGCAPIRTSCPAA